MVVAVKFLGHVCDHPLTARSNATGFGLGQRSARPLHTRLRKRQEIIYLRLSPGQPITLRPGRTSQTWSLEGAHRWAKLLRAAIDRGDDPEPYNRERKRLRIALSST